MKVTKDEYLKYKQEVRGIYKKLNYKIIPQAMYKIVNYDNMVKLAKEFEKFDDFIYYFTVGKDKKIDRILDEMLNKAKNESIDVTKDIVKKCLIVRFGNVFFGFYAENLILKTLTNLSPYIICNKATDEEDMNNKIDATLEIAGIDKIAIQIKPITFLNYNSGNEAVAHQNYFLEHNNNVVYFFYDNEYNLIIKNTKISLENTDELTSFIEKLIIGDVY